MSRLFPSLCLSAVGLLNVNLGFRVVKTIALIRAIRVGAIITAIPPMRTMRVFGIAMFITVSMIIKDSGFMMDVKHIWSARRQSVRPVPPHSASASASVSMSQMVNCTKPNYQIFHGIFATR